MAARPRVIKETPVSALVDGDGGLGHLPARFAMQVAIEVAIEKAKQSGMAVAAVRRSAHFGATGYYTLMAARGVDRYGVHRRVEHLWWCRPSARKVIAMKIVQARRPCSQWR